MGGVPEMNPKIRHFMGYLVIGSAVVVMIGDMMYEMGIKTFLDIFWMPAVVFSLLGIGLFLTLDK